MSNTGDHTTLRMPLGVSMATNNNNNGSRKRVVPQSDLPDEDYDLKSLKEKLQLAYKSPSPFVMNFSSVGGASYFWFICVSELYVLIQYAIPFAFSEYSDTAVYYIKVFSWFVFIQTVANWLCTRFFNTSLFATDDNPEPLEPDNSGSYSNEYNHESGEEKGDLPHKYCQKCDLDMPYRTHHCPLCRKCILKRDHHCYFTGVCIGFYNQRFFIMLNFYIILASVWGLYVISHYMKHHFLPASNWDYVLPVTCWNWWFGDGYIEHQVLLMMFQMWTLWWTGAAAVGFFFWHMVWLVPQGKTPHEATSKTPVVRCTGSRAENFRCVFGSFWLVNFVFPAVIVYPQEGDGKRWPNLKLIRQVGQSQKKNGK